MLPNFIIAGATRSGTTSLYYYLKQHPEIDFPELKEPRFFSSVDLILPQKGPGDDSVDNKLILTYDDYEKIYKNCNNTIVGDASSEYLYHHKKTTVRIKETLGNIPILIILRNPIDRAYSAYSNLVRDGREDENFETALELEKDRILNNYDMMWAYQKVSLYADQVESFLKTFSRVKVIIFEEFVENPKKLLKEIFKFLKVDPDFVSDTSVKFSYSGKPRTKLITMLFGRKSNYSTRLRSIIFNLIPRHKIEKLTGYILKKEEMKSETRFKLNEFFKKDIERLQQILEKDLSFWK